MALISFFSAKGAPGVTTTAMLTAALWPRQSLLVDADNVGGDVGLRLIAPSGAALLPKPGLLSLLPLARHGLVPSVVLEHTQVALGGQRVLTGLENPVQAEAANALWPVLARGFAQLPNTDVIIDAGQIGTRGGQIAMIQHSDVAIGVIRADPSSVVHMRRRMRWLADSLAPLGAEAPRLGLVCVERVNRQDEAAAAIRAVREEVSGLLYVGQVARDRKGVRMFHGEPVDRPERQMIVRSGRTLVEQLAAAVGEVAWSSAESDPEPGDAPSGSESGPDAVAGDAAPSAATGSDAAARGRDGATEPGGEFDLGSGEAGNDGNDADLADHEFGDDTPLSRAANRQRSRRGLIKRRSVP